MIRTQPRGSFLILGFMKELVNGISAGFSSFIHFARFLQAKTISFVAQSISVRLASKVPLPKSNLLASRSSAS